MCHRSLCLLTLVTAVSACTSADDEKPTRPSAKPSATDLIDTTLLEQMASTYRFRLGQPRHVRFSPTGDSVFFLQSKADDFVQSLYTMDMVSGAVEKIAGTETFLGEESESLSDEERARRERARQAARGITAFELSSDGKFVLVPLSGRLFTLELESGTTKEWTSSAESEPVIDPQLAPNDRHVAFVRGGDLWVLDFDGKRERRIVRDPGSGKSVGVAEFVAQEEMGRYHGFWWSPDSRHIAYQETDESEVGRLYRPDLADPHAAPVAQAYPRAGEQNAIVDLRVISVWGGPSTELRWQKAEFPYLAAVEWSANAPLTLVVQDRAQQTVLVLRADPESGYTKELLRETDSAWVNLDSSVPRWTEDGTHFLWSSEREGTWELELRAKDGSLARVLVPAGNGYRELGGIIGGAAVVVANEEPTTSQVLKVALDTGETKEILAREGVHSVTSTGPSGAFSTVSDSLDGKPVYRVYSDDEQTRILPMKAAIPDTPPRTEIKEAAGIMASVTRPRQFDSEKKYPVIVHVYAGPTHQMVQKRSMAYWVDQWLADQGFIVVRADGRGTPGRSGSWQRAIRGDFFSAPLEDQATALRALGAELPEFDLTRVGIFGWSFGGYASAMAVLRRPEVFHAAVAGAPVVDWLEYDTHYTERYLGVPGTHEDEAYSVSNVTRYADQSDRPLMLIHGTADDNVFFSHSLKLSDALTRAGKKHRFLPLVNETHMVRDPKMTAQLYKSIVQFFRDELSNPAADLGRDPSRAIGAR